MAVEIRRNLSYSVWTISVHRPKPLHYSVYCDSTFCQPRDAAKRAKRIATEDNKAGAASVWTGVFCSEDGECYNQHYNNAPPDINETIEHISKYILSEN